MPIIKKKFVSLPFDCLERKTLSFASSVFTYRQITIK